MYSSHVARAEDEMELKRIKLEKILEKKRFY